MVEEEKLEQFCKKKMFFTVFLSKILRKKREGDPENLTHRNMLGKGRE